MKNIQAPSAPFHGRGEKRLELESSSEDGFSLSRRSVLTEKLLPPRWEPVPVARRRGPQSVPPAR